MPAAALALTSADAVARAAELAGVLSRVVDAQLDPSLVSSRSAEEPPDAHRIGDMDRVEIDDPAATAQLLEGPPTSLTCPECGGTLWEQADTAGVIRYSCHVGHAYSMASLLEEQGRDLESTLWSAVRALEERADVHRRLARRSGGGREAVYEDRAKDAETHARS